MSKGLLGRSNIPPSIRAELIKNWRELSEEEKQLKQASLSAAELRTLYALPEARLYAKQDVPEGSWRYCLFRCGRGFGKTVLGSAWLAAKIMDGAMVTGMYGPTFTSDAEQVMVPALLSWFPEGADAPRYNAGKHRVEFSNGALCHVYSSDTEVRGPNLEYLWVDEIVKHCQGIPEKIKERFDTIDYSVRVGRCPQVLITSTPKPFAWFNDFQKRVNADDPAYICRTGTLLDNPHLADDYKQNILRQHGGTRMGRQEIYGDLLEASEGALWTRDLLDETRFDISRDALRTMLSRVVVGVDPSVTDSTTSDLTGIVVVGLLNDGRAIVLADYSGQYSPNTWALKVDQAVRDWDADCVVAESNQGGQLVETNIRTVNRWVRIKLVHAKRGKILRAEPVAALWEQKRAGVNGDSMVSLENEMCTFDGNPKAKSPDRLDALVYAIHELSLNKVYVNRDLEALPYF